MERTTWKSTEISSQLQTNCSYYIWK